ncbi:lactate utilization protein [Gottschalkiaceae bacterium SANA]|nr:lactate utilization protein [Gottschalkiaceae bacterium SANA]
MDQNTEFVTQRHIERTLENLKKNRMNGYYAVNQEELMDILDGLCQRKNSVSVGGSMTLFETGVIDWLRTEDFEFYDRYADGLTKEDITAIYRKSFGANYYFTSTNALTEAGELVNIDGTGNRVASMIYGPDKVIVIVGINKLVKDEAAAWERLRNFAAPANSVRLNRKTPCATNGQCSNCNSPERICASYVTIRRQMNPDRIHVILVDEHLGY